MSRATVVKVPQVHGMSSPLMWELIEDASGRGLCGWEKSWTAQNLPGLDVFGIRDKGDVWKGPNSASNCLCVKGPMYQPASNSLQTMSLYISGRVLIEW